MSLNSYRCNYYSFFYLYIKGTSSVLSTFYINICTIFSNSICIIGILSMILQTCFIQYTDINLLAEYRFICLSNSYKLEGIWPNPASFYFLATQIFSLTASSLPENWFKLSHFTLIFFRIAASHSLFFFYQSFTFVATVIAILQVIYVFNISAFSLVW